MAKRKAQDTGPRIPVELVIPKPEAQEKIQSQVDEGENLLSRSINNEIELEQYKTEEKIWDDFNKELLTRIFNTDEISNEYSAFIGGIFSMSPTFRDRIKYVTNDIKKSIDRLRSILRRLELIPVAQEVAPVIPQTPGRLSSNKHSGKDVFIVHGHDNGLKETVARSIERLKLITIILHEQPNEGRTIIEKFEHYSNVGFAIVILTPDDFGGKSGTDNSTFKPRSRQNVILELGYFLGALGRNKVCALYQQGVELPSDIAGVLYIPFDDQGAWKFQLAREIKAAGIDVDLNDAV